MDRDQDGLFEEFQQARRAAVEDTDRYRGLPAEDPGKEALWRTVVGRTERAQQLLKRWLQSVDAPEPETELVAGGRQAER